MRQERLYLLRLWRDGYAQDDWRYSLEDLRTHERHIFATFKDLTEFIGARTAERPGQEVREGPADI